MESYIKNSVSKLRSYFDSGATKSIDFRITQLKRLKEYIIANETEILDAVSEDLGKSMQEGYLTEISIVMGEINTHLKNLRKWSKPQRVATPLHILPSSSKIIYEPLGVALIIAPWNYPFNLLLTPLVGAISSGCCAMLKPSPAASATAKVVVKMIKNLFDPNYIDIVEGRRDVNAMLLEQRYDIIFFTGSPDLGRVVSMAAAKYLTPVVLELGGKSPCIVDRDADIKIAARRIAWGKCLNSGQTCIAPDYLFVHQEVKYDLLQAIKSEITKMFGENPRESKFFPRIINKGAFERITKYMAGEKIYFGGDVDADERYIAPTIIDNVTPESPVMQEEIFGPLLPVMTFDSIREVYRYVNSHEKPLALYYFGRSGDEVLENTTSGGACINDTIMHISNHNLPFGGVGNSGSGRYHGRDSFMTFSNRRAVVTTPTWIDLPFKYVPFRLFGLIKKIL